MASCKKSYRKCQKKDNLIVLGDWNAKVGKDAQTNWQDTCGPICNAETNERGHRLLEFAMYNELIWPTQKHLEDGPSTAQMENITLRSNTSW